MLSQSTFLCACGCGLPVSRPGFRYRRSHKNPGPTLAERLWAKVDKNGPVPPHRPDLGGCWLFTGYVDPAGGYGQIFSGEPVDRVIHAHRAAWLVTFGAIPPGLDCCHHCDVRTCVRPDHLWLGTRADNLADMRTKGRGRGPGLKGMAHPAATIDDDMVRAIRHRLAAHERHRDIALTLGVTQSIVDGISAGKTWKHVQ